MVGQPPPGSAGAVTGALGASLGGGLRAAALAHREADPRAPMSRGAVRALSLLLTAVNLGLGAMLLTAGLLASTLGVIGRAAAVAVGAFWCVSAALLARAWSLRPSTRRVVSTSTADGSPATVIRMSRRRMAEALWLSSGILVLSVAGSIAALSAGSPGLLVFTGPLVAILLPVVLDMVLAITRPVGIALTPEHLEVASWFSHVSVPWSAMWRVELLTTSHGTRLWISTHGSEPPVRLTRLFSFWPGQERSTRERVVIDVDAIEPHGRPLEALLLGLIRDPALRGRLGGSWTERALEPGQAASRSSR